MSSKAPGVASGCGCLFLLEASAHHHLGRELTRLRHLPLWVLPAQTPRSLDSGMLRVGKGEVKFQTFMQKSFTCKAHLQIPPPMHSFSILHFFPLQPKSLPALFSTSASPSCCLLLGLQAGAPGAGASQAVHALQQEGSSLWPLGDSRRDPAAQQWLWRT